MGYILKSKLINGSIDLTTQNQNLPKKVNLKDNCLQIIHPANSTKTSPNFDNIETFQKYLNENI